MAPLETRTPVGEPKAGAGGAPANGVKGETLRYCPRCSAKLEPRSCKLPCLSCGYYMSCSDFY